MILNEKTLIKVSKKNIEHLKSKGYDASLKDVIEISTKDINIGSHIKIDVQCDVCGERKNLLFQKYVKNVSNGNFYACSSKCSQQKVINTNIKIFGETSYAKTKIFKDRILKISNEKYGCDHFTQNENVKNKSIQTNLKKYGVETSLLSDESKEKTRNTNLEKYGVENVFSSEIIKEKIKKTNLKKYNKEYPTQNDEIKEKVRITNLKNFGTTCYLALENVQIKARKSYFDKYGLPFGTLTKDMLDRSKKSKKDKWIRKVLKNNINIKYVESNDETKNYIFKCDKEHVFEIPFVILIQRNSLGTKICTKCNPIDYHTSGMEIQLLNFVENNYNGEILKNEKIIPPYELDIYLPELKLAFEFNGLYWHSESWKENDYHLNKTKMCQEKDIRLIHVYEDDWKFKQDIIESRILNLLGKSERIYARKCSIKEIKNTPLVREFLEKNHIQGFVGSNIKIGLFYDDELVSLMSFGNFRKNMGRNKFENSYEMMRFCNKLNINVIGGASRLFKFFIEKYDPMEVISYADRSWSRGNLYEKLNFNFVRYTPPNYSYIIDKIHRQNRFNFRKDKLIKEGFDPNKSEHQIMMERGISRIYDSGSILYLWKK